MDEWIFALYAPRGSWPTNLQQPSLWGALGPEEGWTEQARLCFEKVVGLQRLPLGVHTMQARPPQSLH